MIITATELKTNLGKYLKLVNDEDVLITRNGKVIARLSKPKSNKIAAIRSLVGIADNGSDISPEEIKAGRLKRQ